MDLRKKLRWLHTTYLEHSSQFGNGTFLSFTVAIVPRVLFVLHAVFSVQLLKKYLRYENIQSSSKLKLTVVWQPTSIDIQPFYIGLALLAFESVYTILVRKGHEYKHIWLSGFLYLLTQIPVICCIEYAFFQKRRAYYELTTGQTSSNSTVLAFTKAPYHPDTFLNCFHLAIELNCTEQFIKNFAELGMISVIIIGRWMLPRGELTRDQLSALLIGYVNTAADLTEFIGLHSKQALSREKNAIIVILALYCVSLLQFVVITTSTTYEYSENEKEVIKSLSANLSYSKAKKYTEPLGAKLGRLDMMRNVDSLATAAFRSGHRAGERRRGIAAIGVIGRSPTQQVVTVDDERRGDIAPSKRSIDDSKTNPGVNATGNPTTNMRRVQNIERQRQEKLVSGRRTEKEAYENSDHSESKERSNKLERWKASLHASVRLDAIRRYLIEEDWKQLSQTLVDMKASKRMQVPVEVESAISTVLREYNREEEKTYSSEEDSDESEDEESRPFSWHRWLEVVQTEMGGLLIALFLQEIPFFFSRVAFIYQYKVFDRGLVFYTTKNFFMLCFLNYRLWVATAEN